ncbi:MAG TPA: hypothetical protein VIS07_20265 [Candidatus Binatia bacterium]
MQSILVAVVGIALVLGVGVPAHADKAKRASAVKASPEELQAEFKRFCDSWMEKLRERERHNIANIEWKPNGTGVVGEYIGYDTTNVQIPEITNADTTPIGRVIYHELKLRLSGASQVDALAQQPEIIERTEVTELFRYERGNWVY